MENELKNLRLANGFTQAQASDFLGVSLRSYKTYETSKEKEDSIRYQYMMSKLKQNLLVDENKGILSIDDIRKTVGEILREYPVKYCYLFGSYAKGKQKEDSDVDLVISGDVNGLKFYGLVEKLREALHKRVDLLKVNQLVGNEKLLDEVLKDGIRIYG